MEDNKITKEAIITWLEKEVEDNPDQLIDIEDGWT
jgi:hypothetical protein